MSLSDAAIRHLQRTLDVPDAGERYEVLGEIGRGGMGTVYRAMDHQLGREVALKAIAFHADAGVTERLSREARVLAQLEHPGIVAVHDVGTLADGRPFYVMRLVRGTNLAQHAAGRGRGELLRRFLQVCDAVAFAHARGVIHRDLTPRNVMIGEFGEVLVVDWGVARVLGARGGAAEDGSAAEGGSAAAGEGARGLDLGIGHETSPVAAGRASGDALAAGPQRTGDGVIVGTPGYMPPEAAAGGARDVDERGDVFGLGAILRDLLAASGAPAPRPLAAIVARATALLPDDRYASAAALAADVRRWFDAEPVQAYRENALERAARFYGRNRPLILLLLAYAVVRVTILLWRGV